VCVLALLVTLLSPPAARASVLAAGFTESVVWSGLTNATNIEFAADGCVVSGRLSRLTAAGNQMTGPEQVLINGWCQQYPSHWVGDLAFGTDGALYVTAGDGASFNFAD
jgi:glucose/arabinose dehydrogenase